jgi:hypothetical protein
MNADALELALTSFTARAPFRPFVVELVNGQRIEIRHPEAVAIWAGLVVFRDNHGRFQLFDHRGVCRLLDAETTKEGTPT